MKSNGRSEAVMVGMGLIEGGASAFAMPAMRRWRVKLSASLRLRRGKGRAKDADGWILSSDSGIQPCNLVGGAALATDCDRVDSLTEGGWGARTYEITKRTQLTKWQARGEWQNSGARSQETEGMSRVRGDGRGGSQMRSREGGGELAIRAEVANPI